MNAYKKYIIDGITEKEDNDIRKYQMVNKLFKAVGAAPFWAKDVEDIVSPAMLAEFRRLQIVENTGVEKETFICIDEYQNYYRKVTVKQWRFCENTTGYEMLSWKIQNIAEKYARLMRLNSQIVEDIADAIKEYRF